MSTNIHLELSPPAWWAVAAGVVTVVGLGPAIALIVLSIAPVIVLVAVVAVPFLVLGMLPRVRSDA